MYIFVFSKMMAVLFLPIQTFKFFLFLLFLLARISNTMAIEEILVSFQLSGGKLLSMILAVEFLNRHLLS